jgi:hypothetical protein
MAQRSRSIELHSVVVSTYIPLAPVFAAAVVARVWRHHCGLDRGPYRCPGRHLSRGHRDALRALSAAHQCRNVYRALLRRSIAPKAESAESSIGNFSR